MKEIAIVSILIALTCASTMIFTIYIPATKGFFNIGESMVYISALSFGAKIGAIAGGLGSAFADLFLGYYHYAPATFFIKGTEGFIVGFLSHKRIRISQKRWKILTTLLGIPLAILIALIGSLYFTGHALQTIGFFELSIEIPRMFWISLAIIVFIFVSLLGYFFSPELGWLILSILFGGAIMVSGYFLYEFMLFGYGALVEVPFNIAQALIGLIIALPVYRSLKKLIPSL